MSEELRALRGLRRLGLLCEEGKEYLREMEKEQEAE